MTDGKTDECLIFISDEFTIQVDKWINIGVHVFTVLTF